MKLKLPDGIASPQDLASLIQEVSNYARWFKHESIKKQVNVKHASESPILSAGATEMLHTWASKNPLNQHSLDELISTLKDYGKNAPLITITLAAPANSSLKNTLVGWCRENIASNILVSFQFNSNLLGGMVVRYGSRIFDWSFKRQILAARSNFPEVLRRV